MFEVDRHCKRQLYNWQTCKVLFMVMLYLRTPLIIHCFVKTFCFMEITMKTKLEYTKFGECSTLCPLLILIILTYETYGCLCIIIIRQNK